MWFNNQIQEKLKYEYTLFIDLYMKGQLDYSFLKK